MSNSSKYVKKSHLEHILDRPDSYVGSCEGVAEKHWVLNEDKTRISLKTVDNVPGLYKIYDEVLNNAIDQSVLDPCLDCIKVKVSQEDGIISVYNTTGAGGDYGIPVEMHPTYNIYTPELIFGNLLTSSNYDDNQERITGGRNGYGAKLANIFSKWFEVEVADMSRNLHYHQRFEDNMKTVNPPKIKPLPKSVKKGYVQIRFCPDLARFKNHGLPMTSMHASLLALFERRAYDAAACTKPDVAVYFNDKKIPVKNFEKYVDMYLGGGTKEKQRAYEKIDDRWEVCVAASQDVETEPDDFHGFLQMSFVNGIATTKGGTHVNFILNQILEKIKGTVKKAADLKPFDLRERMFLFVRCTLVNPVFSSQTKEECTSKMAPSSSKLDIPETFVKKISKIEGIVDAALERSMQRLMTKTDGAKRSAVNVPKLEDASKAGTAESHKCTLVLTEGDSAKTFAISGLSEVDRRYWGVFPLRGKLLNVRDASARQVAENQEITYLKQILGLQHGKEYERIDGLRYGRVMILTDADSDGIHIKGLVLNFFHSFWPSLLRLNFVCTMNTPVVKVFKGSQPIKVFYTVREYKAWKDSVPDLKGLRIKYYKGLGTSTAVEAKEYFKEVGKSTVTFCKDETGDESMELAFRRNQAGKRKEWVSGASPDETSIDATRANTVQITDFINKDLVLFSMEDVVRSIPNIMDGLKPSQRKVLYACIRRNLTQEIRVSQLAGYVSEITSYHHGEQSLCGTIVGMAQNYVGSNNMNILAPIGQFGTRLAGGKDCASPRYIFTRLEPWVGKVFCQHDEALLTYMDDDGTPIEPRIYYPILPMVLVNGAEGIGTGFSTNVPPYNPKDITENIESFIRGEEMKPMIPWFQGFKGEIRQKADNPSCFEIRGLCEWDGPNKMVIKELPIGLWTTDYKEALDNSTRLSSIVQSYENMSSEKEVLFKLKIREDSIDKVRQDPLKELDLIRVIHTNNMHLFDEQGIIRRYEDAREILTDFCKCRQRMYAARKVRLLQDMREESAALEKEVRFVKLVVDGDLVVFKRKVPDILEDMKKHDIHDPDLLKLSITRFTQEHIDAMNKKRQTTLETIDKLEKTSPSELWTQDLKKL